METRRSCAHNRSCRSNSIPRDKKLEDSRDVIFRRTPSGIHLHSNACCRSDALSPSWLWSSAVAFQSLEQFRQKGNKAMLPKQPEALQRHQVPLTRIQILKRRLQFLRTLPTKTSIAPSSPRQKKDIDKRPAETRTGQTPPAKQPDRNP